MLKANGKCFPKNLPLTGRSGRTSCNINNISQRFCNKKYFGILYADGILLTFFDIFVNF